MIGSVLREAGRLARIDANRALLRFVNGIEWLMRDPTSVVGRTPYETIHRAGKLEVRRYHLGRVRASHPVPIVLVPPLMVKPFIYDLMPGRSLVAFLLQRGFRVYVVDFGEPDQADQFVRLDHYILDWMPEACEAVRRDAGMRTLSLFGYCMGGIFCLTHTAANEDRDVRNIVCLAVPVDMSKMGLLAWVAKLAGGQVDAIARRLGNVPGGLSSTAFKLLTPAKNFTRYADLFLNLWNEEFVNGFDAMNQWVSQFIDYPRDAFLQFNREFLQRNKLVRGQLTLRGKVADLRRIEANLLVFAGKTDQIAPPASVRVLLDKVSSTDKTFLLVPGGHMGVLAGARAPQEVWEPMANWLAARSQVRASASARRAGRHRTETVRATRSRSRVRAR
jgi:polyhydroxyalkanoate synthase